MDAPAQGSKSEPSFLRVFLLLGILGQIGLTVLHYCVFMVLRSAGIQGKIDWLLVPLWPGIYVGMLFYGRPRGMEDMGLLLIGVPLNALIYTALWFAARKLRQGRGSTA